MIKLMDLLFEASAESFKVKWVEETNNLKDALVSWKGMLKTNKGTKPAIPDIIDGLFSNSKKLKFGGAYTKYFTPEYAFILKEDERFGALRRGNVIRYTMSIYNAGIITIKPGSRNLSKEIPTIDSNKVFIFNEDDVDLTKGDAKWSNGYPADKQPGQKAATSTSNNTVNTNNSNNTANTNNNTNNSNDAADNNAYNQQNTNNKPKTYTLPNTYETLSERIQKSAKNFKEGADGMTTNDDVIQMIAALKSINNQSEYDQFNLALAYMSRDASHDIEYYIKDNWNYSGTWNEVSLAKEIESTFQHLRNLRLVKSIGKTVNITQGTGKKAFIDPLFITLKKTNPTKMQKFASNNADGASISKLPGQGFPTGQKA